MTTQNPTLYQFVVSASCEKVRRALHHKGVTWNTVEVDWYDRSALEKISGQRLAPYFVHGDVKLGPSSIDVLDYIEEAFPGPTLYPDNSWGYCHMINEYSENVLFPLGGQSFLAAAATVMNSEVFDKDVLRITGKTPKQLQDNLRGLFTVYAKQLDYLDRHLKDRKYFIGEKLSAADHIVYSSFWFATNNPEFAKMVAARNFKHLDDWAARMKGDFFTKLPF
jgi:glutathione S-transferase